MNYLTLLLAYLRGTLDRQHDRLMHLIERNAVRFARLTDRLGTRCYNVADWALARTDATRLADAVPGWWDFDVDCAGRDCGECLVCEWAREDQAEGLR